MSDWKKHVVDKIKSLSDNHKSILNIVENNYMNSHLFLISKNPDLRLSVASLIQIKKNDKTKIAILFGVAIKTNHEFNMHFNSFKTKVDIIMLDNVDPLILDDKSLEREFIHLGYDQDHNLEIFNKFTRINIGE